MATDKLSALLNAWDSWLIDVKRHAFGRDLKQLSLTKNQARAFIGVRRCGKTFTAAKLLSGVARGLYLNFEDPFFIEHHEVGILDDIISAYTAEHKMGPETLVFDEIHNIDGWERWVRKMVDLKKYKILVTGSSAKMLSSELATALTGRALTTTIWPLSFSENLRFRKKICTSTADYDAALLEYLQWGGFPEVVLTPSAVIRNQLLQQYLTDIVYKDIIRRYEIRTARNLEQLLRFYLTNISNLHSYNSVRKAFGLNIETAKDYTSHFQDSFLIFEVNRFHPNLKVQSRDAKKIYAIDTGLRNVNAATQTDDLGKLAENAAYIHLRRRGKTINYFKEKSEVDFLLTDFGKPNEAIQVCFDDMGNPQTWEREINSLLECLTATKLKTGTILTRMREETITLAGRTITLKPLSQFLLEDSL